MRSFFVVHISDLHIEGNDDEIARLDLLKGAISKRLSELQSGAPTYVVDQHDEMAVAELEICRQLASSDGIAAGSKTPDDSNLVRFVALHHHPLPIADGEGKKELGLIPDESFMYLHCPATFLSSVISIRTHLILHGHRHVAGMTRYSIPATANIVTDASTDSEAWPSIYVLSCPSSTGKSCDAGFNIIEFAEEPYFSSYRPMLYIYRMDTAK